MNIQRTIRVIRNKYPDVDIVAIHKSSRIGKTLVVVNFPISREVKIFSKTPKPIVLKNGEQIIVMDVKFLIKKLISFDPLTFILFYTDEIYVDEMYEILYRELKFQSVRCIEHSYYIDYAVNSGDDLAGFVATVYKSFYDGNGDIRSFRFTSTFDDSIEFVREKESEIMDLIENITISDGVCKKILDDILLKIKLLNII